MCQKLDIRTTRGCVVLNNKLVGAISSMLVPYGLQGAFAFRLTRQIKRLEI
jgi:hypothetical protein